MHTDEATWRVYADTEHFFIHHWWNIGASWIGYLLFWFIIHACNKKRVFWIRFNDVLILLIFAFLADILKMRMHLFFVFSKFEGSEGEFDILPTTVAACTMGLWIFYSYFFITYVEAIVSIYRFLNRFCRISITAIYLAIGAVFAVQASHLFETFLHGKPEDLRLTPSMPISCSRAYFLDGLYNLNMQVTIATMAVTPILSLLMACKRSRTLDYGVTFFIFLSSMIMAAFVFAVIIILGDWIPQKYWDYSKMYIIVAYNILDFRFPILCVLAILIVADIRRAVFSTIDDSIRMVTCRQQKSDYINDAFVE